MSGKLYVVGTPIGNLGDMSPRAVETLEMVDFIAAEDTRVTLKLLNHFSIKKPMISYFEHNKYERGEIICQRILSGENCAVVTDAGMPCISDPGELLVKQCREYGIKVAAVPGASAVITALALSGLPTGRFTFEGFLSVNKKSRREHLNEVKNEKRTMIFYEAPHKLNATLRDMLEAFGDRNIAVVRELTKIHEEVINTTLEKAVAEYIGGIPSLIGQLGRHIHHVLYGRRNIVPMYAKPPEKPDNALIQDREANALGESHQGCLNDSIDEIVQCFLVQKLGLGQNRGKHREQR